MNDFVPNWLQQRARISPNHVALIYERQLMSFAALAARAIRASARLWQLGIRRGDRVALLMSNRPEFAELIHGLTRLGAVAVPLNSRLSPPELTRQLVDCRANLLVSDLTVRNTVAAVRSALPLPVVSVDRHTPEDDCSLADIEPDVQTDAAQIDLQTVHSIVYTSGSTGHPKGVLLTCGNHLWSAIGSAFNLGVHADDRWLACLPFCHVGGLAILVRGVTYGITVVMHKGFDPERVNRAIDAERVTILSVVANMLQRLLDTRGERPYPPWLRCVLLGGGPVPLALLEACAARRIPVMQTYGLTEAASQVATLAPRDAARKLGSAGKPLLPTEVVLSGPAGPVPAGEVGEILIRGPTVSPGYVGEAGAANRPDGWLPTGDLGRYDEEGFLYITGRRDDMIVSGGENIAPAEVEAALQSHPAVAEACVFGVPDQQWGATVAASVRLRPGTTVSVVQLKEYVRRCLAGFKIPRLIQLVDEFPRTASGKIIRRQVQANSLARGDRSGR
ncbi:MAG: o-succinylbenzoate--CoA ligase [Candidatus Binatia bacterium]